MKPHEFLGRMHHFLWGVLFLMSFESKALVYVVDNTLNTDNLAAYTLSDGTNSLRKCLRLCNVGAGLDSIYFAIPSAPYVIAVPTPALNFTAPVFINGFTQPGASPGSPLIELSATGGINVIQLSAGSNGSTIKGLVIYGVGGVGIQINNSSNQTIEGNFIGTNVTATGAVAGSILATGIVLTGATASNNIIGGLGGVNTRNIIAGINGRGINIQASVSNTVVQGNYLGVNNTGNATLPNNSHAIETVSQGALTVGGTSYSARNIIGGNNVGIRVQNCTTLVVKGNFIGTGVNGLAAVNNNGHAIELLNPTSGVIIGGLTLPERNVIGGHPNGSGVSANTSPGITIVNNYFGTDSTGLILRANQVGINLAACNNAVIGGTTYTARNIVCGSTQDGVRFTGITSNITIKGNFIGLGADGATTIANAGDGIDLQGGSITNVVVGGTTRPERNVIAGNSTGCGINGGVTGITVVNNFFGTDSTGLLQRNNQSAIILSPSSNAVIGGVNYNCRNIIAGTTQQGLSLTNGNIITIKGNFIGLGVDGITAIPIGQNGINLGNPTSNVNIGGLTHPERNVIGSCGSNAIQVNTSPSIIIVNNYIGTDSTGLLQRTITQSGISLNTSSNAVIGGTVYAARNVFASCTQNAITATNTSNLIIKGNFIGLSANGTTTVGAGFNIGQQGINLANPNSAVTIGGLTHPERNIIASCGQNAIQGNTCAGFIAYNNYIGTDSTGMLVRACNGSGINLTACSSVQIGGTSYAMRNIISNSTNNHGITLATCSTAVNIKGNFIGVASDGITPMGNRNNGIQVQTSTPVVIGGPTAIERNIVASSTNANGIQVNNSAAVSIQNNYVGTDSTGMLARGNFSVGITCSTISGGLIIGGSTYNLRNIIASNGNNGITVSAAPGVIIRGNFVGFPKDGQTARGNGQHGIAVSNSAGALIGGASPEERNVVGNNANQGIQLNTCSSSIILNNYIGTDSTGLLARGNTSVGLSASNSTNLIIGGIMFSTGNLIANNNSHGIALTGTSSFASIKGNIIGLALNGITPMQNRGHGIELSSSYKAIIGGITVAERNLIANAYNQGIQVSNSDTVQIFGNYIGVDISGNLNRGGRENGINISGSKGVQVGSANYGARNIVSGNGQAGIKFNGNCPGAIVKGNFCGLGADGSTSISNLESGIHFGGSASDGAIIGGSLYSERNVCSSNGTTTTGAVSRDGIRIDGNSNNHIIKGNFCGVDSTGTLPRGNTWAGISLNECKNVVVGGTGSFEGNICSDNFHEGFYLRNDTNCTIIGNFIGTDRSATLDLGNYDYGINIRYRSYMNFIGGGTTAEGNIIANTKNVTGIGSGVFIDSLGWRNKVVRNKIYCNAEKGIHLGNTANESIAAPGVMTSDANTISGVGSIDGDSIHIYRNIKTGGACDCEGESYLGGTVVSGGTWSFTHGLNLSGGLENNLTATETTLLGSTSEFSDCFVPLPVHFLSFDAKKNTASSALITWTTATETNNRNFEVQRSVEGQTFESIGIVAGSGTSTSLQQYSFVDLAPVAGVNYYRLKQVDLDGQSSHSEIKSVHFGNQNITILSQQAGFTIELREPTSDKLTYRVHSTTGAVLQEKEMTLNAGTTQVHVPLHLAESVYMVTVYYQNEVVREKIVISR